MPSPETVRKAIAAMQLRADYEYFFSRLDTPDWIQPLYDEGFFRNAPQPVEAEGKVQYPFWPESRYLARMAGEAPELVTRIILDIPPTKNFRVNEDFADAALAMPPEFAARLASKASDWLDDSFHLLLPRKLKSLCTSLATGGEVASSFELYRFLLEILPGPSETKNDLLPPEPRSRLKTWDYEEILTEVTRVLVGIDAEATINLLLELLLTAVNLSTHSQSEPEDYSYIWRKDIGSDGGDDLKNLLVSAARDAIEQTAGLDSDMVPLIASELEKMPWRVFHRMEHYLLSLHPGVARERLSAVATDRAHFDEFRSEYADLLAERFGELPEEDRDLLFTWIRHGLDIEEVKRSWLEFDNNITESDVLRYERLWKRDRLQALNSYLDAELSREYNELVLEFGAGGQPEPASVWVGHESPRTAVEIQKMNVASLVDFLKNWKSPEGGWRVPSPEGLGQALATAVGADPRKFEDETLRFTECDPIYVRNLIAGFRQAAANEVEFSWKGPLAVCKWAVAQQESVGQALSDSLDREWRSIRNGVADLIEQGLKNRDFGIPVEFRQEVWAPLSILAEDRDPDPQDSTDQDGDPLTVSLNTIRGGAMHCVVQYALWLRRHFERTTQQNRIARGFSEMPEVRRTLERHLDLTVDRSLAIRAVYGQWFPWLHLLDPKWARDHLTAVFPDTVDSIAWWLAAWQTYVTRNQPYNNVVEAMRPVYDLALRRIGNGGQKVAVMLADPNECLAEHLMILYWRGQEHLSGDGLLRRFYDNPRVNEGLRGHAIEFLGRSLYEAKGEVDSEVLERLRDLFEKRLDDKRAVETPAEFRGFGWWFASGAFDEKWSIDQLSKVSELTPGIEPDHLVVERLSELYRIDPYQVVSCLEKIVRRTDDSVAIYGWQEEARKILVAAVREEKRAVRDLAVDLIHWLGARGHLGFREILRNARD